MPALQERLDFMVDFAERAGKMALEKQPGIAYRLKSDGSPVTEVDETINELFINEAGLSYPGEPVIGEEASSELDKGAKPKDDWVIDPVDGTKAFTDGRVDFCVGLSYLRFGYPQASVVYAPATGDMYTAIVNQGSFHNDTRLKVNEDETAITASHDYCFWEGIAKPRRLNLLSEIVKVEPQEVQSALLQMAMVATGKSTFCIFPGNTPHDSAPGVLLVIEAGGKVTDLDGNPQRYDFPTKGHVASNRVVHDELLDIVKELS